MNGDSEQPLDQLIEVGKNKRNYEGFVANYLPHVKIIGDVLGLVAV